MSLSRDERVMSAMVWINLLASLAGLLLLGWAGSVILDEEGKLSLQRIVLMAVFGVWTVAIGSGVWRFLRHPNRAHAREIAMMTALLVWGVLAVLVLRILILGRRGGAMPVAIGLSLLALAAVWFVYVFYLRRIADRLYDR